jgi:hypothetical protein
VNKLNVTICLGVDSIIDNESEETQISINVVSNVRIGAPEIFRGSNSYITNEKDIFQLKDEFEDEFLKILLKYTEGGIDNVRK